MKRGRRQFLTHTVAGAAGLAWSGTRTTAWAMPKTERDALTPAQVIELMKRGNERFRNGVRVNRDFLREQRERASGQYPAAVILSCIDSRAPAELVMDLGIGDVFNTRMAGNVANDDVIGGLEFACAVAGAKAIVVLGHTACGAVAGAIDGVQLGKLTGLLARIEPAVTATAHDGPRTSKDPSFVDAVARSNVELTMRTIRAESELLAQLEAAGSLTIAGAMYDLQTAAVRFLPPY
jgi:carbonic anhydrase